MTDEKRSASNTSSLLDRVNAAPFVPTNRAKDLKPGTSTNVNAKPFTPSGGRISSGPAYADVKSTSPSPRGHLCSSSLSRQPWIEQDEKATASLAHICTIACHAKICKALRSFSSLDFVIQFFWEHVPRWAGFYGCKTSGGALIEG